MPTQFTTTHASEISGQVEPLTLLINGSGGGVSLLIAFLIFAGYMIGREAKR
ncbi:hypothetical protein SAMN05444149_10882 [Pseudosulfitobacter pseudonitzschiae]|uniref:hypothetical protein n=1 Tax=Pseudosulfitobacter pseudonitzschiae TaxID=1402135 RepID=UPI00091FEF6D|nr:hypothetical protein [Pseudosulfitobacter pseudonitzschiae]SHG01102.1 hypothetical protein SAMN05444149_10882 [Pseudosulfitobacter pseudonitzschiae]